MHALSVCLARGELPHTCGAEPASTACKLKRLLCRYAGVSTLQSSWITKASEKQRRGRAGRTRKGIAFHLYSQQRSQELQVRLHAHRPHGATPPHGRLLTLHAPRPHGASPSPTRHTAACSVHASSLTLHEASVHASILRPR